MCDDSAVFKGTLQSHSLMACLHSLIASSTCGADLSVLQARERSGSCQGTSCKVLHGAWVALFASVALLIALDIRFVIILSISITLPSRVAGSGECVYFLGFVSSKERHK